MRSTGVVDSARDLGHHDHLCWGYEAHRDFRDQALVFLDEGLRLGHRILYTGENDVEGLRAELDDISGLDRLIDDGTIQLVQILTTYESRAITDQAQTYASATRHAMDAGYSGLRTVADATVLVLEPDDRDAFVRYEHRMDRLMADGLRFSAMCGYDRTRLGETALGEIGCVHPLVHAAGTPFQVHANGGTSLRLAGEIDAWHESAVEQAFDRTLAASEPHQRLVVDCSQLTFTHHRGLEAINRSARAAGLELTLACAPPTAGTIIELLRLDSLEIMAS